MSFYVLLYFLLMALPSISSATVERLKYGQTLSVINQTLVSSGSVFELGFFNPSKFHTRYYLGIWYHNIPNSPVVWVANRESPLKDVSGYLAFTSNGNLGIFNGNGSIVWSSNATQATNHTEAILLDSGDFVLSAQGNYIWESFDTPTDTLLPNMKLRSYYKLGIAPRCISWAAADDPSPGVLSFGFDPRSSLQVKLWNGSETYRRSSVFIGTQLSLKPVHASFYVSQIASDDEQIYFSYSVAVNSSLNLFRTTVLTHGIRTLAWNQTSRRWDLIYSPASCQSYNRCGPNGVCFNILRNNSEDNAPVCKCLAGFRPKNSTEWNTRNFAGGCMKERVWDCRKEGNFVPYTNMKFNKGSLDRYLFDMEQSMHLAWEKRWQIIEGLAQGILYLHRYSRLRITHRDLKTSNILLDDEMNPKISDFGLARIFDQNQVEVNTERIAGTYGYMSPEYALQGTFSEKSDVFSFGVILLELISGKRNTGSYLYNGSLNLLGYIWQLWVEEKYSEMAYPSLRNSFPFPQLVRCIQVGLLCVQERPADRPAISSVVFMLANNNIVLPAPDKPAFTIGNEVRPSAASSSYFKDSNAQITITAVEAR